MIEQVLSCHFRRHVSDNSGDMRAAPVAKSGIQRCVAKAYAIGSADERKWDMKSAENSSDLPDP